MCHVNLNQIENKHMFQRAKPGRRMSCGCCSPLRARYKRLVDNIFPAEESEGLVNANMQKLIYYAATSPEKWDRIGDYLAYKIGRDLNRSYPRYFFEPILYLL